MSVTPYDAFELYHASYQKLNVERLAETIRLGDVNAVEVVALLYRGLPLRQLSDVPQANLIHALTPIVCRSVDTTGVPPAILKHVQQTMPIQSIRQQDIKPLVSNIRNVYRAADAKMATHASDRILDLSELFQTNVPKDWAHSLQQLRAETYQTGGVLDFLRVLKHDQTVTFQFTPNGRTIHVTAFRKQASALCQDVVGFVMAACSIGLPLQNMYTPREFVKKWYTSPQRRATAVSNDFLVQLALGHVFTDEVKAVRGTRAHQLMDIYEEHYVRIRFEPSNDANLDEYMRDRFYRTPRPQDLQTLAERIQANRAAWLGPAPTRSNTPPPTRSNTPPPAGGESKNGSAEPPTVRAPPPTPALAGRKLAERIRRQHKNPSTNSTRPPAAAAAPAPATLNSPATVADSPATVADSPQDLPRGVRETRNAMKKYKRLRRKLKLRTTVTPKERQKPVTPKEKPPKPPLTFLI